MTSRSLDQPLAEITTSRYLNYALSVITSRALPDIRDGLKPVQRRILYAMYQDLHVGPDARFKKSAKVVGEVMGNYHPHGDQSIYDAMVRLAQTFSMRYPLVEGQGNFGSLDGDRAAAMRYTEARLAHVSIELLDELKQETVDFHPTYDGTRNEPDVLPAQIPNLLVNGSSGIAVGMATNIPPHNLREVVAALLALIKDPCLAEDRLMEMIPGPDFPTGGIILNSREELREIYSTGTGTIRMRGTWKAEKDGRKSYLVLTSIPFGLEKSALVSKIGELIASRQVPQLVDVRDESTEEVRIVCELKSGAAPEAAVAFLYKNTPLATNFHVNLTCLVPTDDGVGVPQRVPLASMLRAFLGFRMTVVLRRHQHELKQLLDKLHVLEGFEKVFADLDRAIALIREAGRRPEALAAIIKEFRLSDRQGNAILDTKLYKLSRLEIADIRQEAKETRERVAEIETILADEELRWAIVEKELAEINDAYGDPRRSRITGPIEEIAFRKEDYIVDEDSWLVVTREGWIKRQRRFTEVESIRIREGDQVGWLYRGRARQAVTLLGAKGSAYTVLLDQVPMTAGYGEPMGRFFSLADGETLAGVICHDPRCLPDPSVSPPPVATPAPFAPGREANDQALLPGLASPPTVSTQAERPAPRSGANGEAADPDANGEKADPDTNGEASGGTDALPPGPYLVAMTRLGRTLRFALASHAEPSTRNGRLYCRLASPFPADRVVGVELSTGDELVAVATRSSRILIFPVGQIPVLAGPGRGVTAIKLAKGDEVIAFALLSAKRPILYVETSRGGQISISEARYRVTARAGKGYTEMSRAQFVRAVPSPVQPVPDRAQIQEQGSDEESSDSSPANGGRIDG